MEPCQFQIRPPEYIGGKNVIERLATGTKSNQELADAFALPNSTVGTWRHRNLVPYEIVIRLHLKTGVSIKWLVLGESLSDFSSNEHSHISKKNEKKSIFDIDRFKLKDGNLVNSGIISFDRTYLEECGVMNVMAILENETTYVINKEVRQAVAGTYLVDMDGLLSLNEIQRLPGRKLAISFNDSTIQVDEDLVRVVERVVLVMRRR